MCKLPYYSCRLQTAICSLTEDGRRTTLHPNLDGPGGRPSIAWLEPFFSEGRCQERIFRSPFSEKLIIAKLPAVMETTIPVLYITMMMIRTVPGKFHLHTDDSIDRLGFGWRINHRLDLWTYFYVLRCTYVCTIPTYLRMAWLYVALRMTRRRGLDGYWHHSQSPRGSPCSKFHRGNLNLRLKKCG